MSAPLYPPLKLLRSDLFGGEPLAAGAPEALEETDPLVQAAAEPMEMPPGLQELVRLGSAARAANPPAPLAVGQIRRLDRIPGANGRALGRSYAVLLGACTDGARWSGWMVAQEADYASDRDLVLQDGDGVFAPEAAMVQAWNPVELSLQGDERILGKLPIASLGAVLRLAEAGTPAGEFVAPRPGRLGAWNLDASTTVVTGTPLGEDDDPRHAYQALYRQLAQEVRAGAAVPAVATAPEAEPPQRFGDWLRATFVRPAWTFAALAIIAGQGLWMLRMGGQPDEGAVYRGAGQMERMDACAVLIRIVFRPDTPYSEIVDALRASDATMAGGPSNNGEIWIRPPQGRDPGELAAMLRQRHLVEQADVVEPDARRCGR